MAAAAKTEAGKGEIYRVAGPVVTATGLFPRMYDVVYVGQEQLLGEVIEIVGDKTIVQVYEDTSGVRPGEPVLDSRAPLVVELGATATQGYTVYGVNGTKKTDITAQCSLSIDPSFGEFSGATVTVLPRGGKTTVMAACSSLTGQALLAINLTGRVVTPGTPADAPDLPPAGTRIPLADPGWQVKGFLGDGWRWELEPTGDGKTRVTETFDMSTSKAPPSSSASAPARTPPRASSPSPASTASRRAAAASLSCARTSRTPSARRSRPRLRPGI